MVFYLVLKETSNVINLHAYEKPVRNAVSIAIEAENLIFENF